MKKTKKILENKFLLNEISLNRDSDIKKAINKVLRVRITYNDKKPNVISNKKGYKERFILPVAYGLTKSGKRAVRAYQTAGSTKRGIPRWKLFLLDNIVSWSNGTKSFKKYGQQLIDLGLNTSGDKGMTTLYAITPIANNNVQVANDSKPITPEPIIKTDVIPSTNSQIPKNEPEIKEPTVSKEKFVPAQTKRNTSIDNAQNKSYFNNKIEAPSTEPVLKTDLVKNEPEIKEPDNTINAPNTEPITKTDINKSEKNADDIKNNFNDMLSRMDNVYKDNNEEDNII